MAKSVLMIAYHYPPEGASSGVQRTLAFSRYLREEGWDPIVLTAHPRAYPVTRSDQVADIPDDVVVRRAFAFDTARHLSLFGRYPRFAALPDRWASWWLGAVVAGKRLIRKYRPRVLWSTYPIATAHLIAASLHKRTGIPWVADFRDSMTEDDYPPDETQRRAYRRIEARTLTAAKRSVFTASSTVRMYQERYPGIEAKRFAQIPNGYDEPSFADAEGGREERRPRHSDPTVLLHSGVLYPSERDPTHFYAALARLSREGQIRPDNMRVILRGTGHDRHHRRLIDSFGLGELVTLAPRLAYREALREMLDVDGLLIFQASNCNHQVPAKIYEYFRARKPILALTDAEGDTARVLREAKLNATVPLDDEERIADGITTFVNEIRNGTARVAGDDEIAKHSRRARTRALARLFDEVAGEGAS